MKARRLLGGFHKSPVGKRIHGPHNQEGRGRPYGRCRNKISELWSHFSSLLLSSYLSSFLLAQTCFSIAPSSSRICGQKGKVSSCQCQGATPSEGPGWVMGPSQDQSLTVSSTVISSPDLWSRGWGALRIPGRNSGIKKFAFSVFGVFFFFF